jgi:hypothetical protein
MEKDFLEATADRLLSLSDYLRCPSSDRQRAADILTRISQSLRAKKPCVPAHLKKPARK